MASYKITASYFTGKPAENLYIRRIESVVGGWEVVDLIKDANGIANYAQILVSGNSFFSAIMNFTTTYSARVFLTEVVTNGR